MDEIALGLRSKVLLLIAKTDWSSGSEKILEKLLQYLAIY